MKSFRQCSLKCHHWECKWKGWWAGQQRLEHPESHTLTAFSSKGNIQLSASCTRWGWHFLATVPSQCPAACICHFSAMSILSREGTGLPSTFRVPVPNTGTGWAGRFSHSSASDTAAFAKTLQFCVWAQAGHSCIAKPSTAPAAMGRKGNCNFTKRGVGGTIGKCGAQQKLQVSYNTPGDQGFHP